MKRSAITERKLDQLRLLVRKILRRRGRQAEMARATGLSPQIINKWFVKGEGRPTADAALAALRWYNERKVHLQGFVPTWSDLTLIMRRIFQVRGLKAECARKCGVTPSQLSHYFSTISKARKPDGEVALRMVSWLRQRFLKLRKKSEWEQAWASQNAGNDDEMAAFFLAFELVARSRNQSQVDGATAPKKRGRTR